LRPLPSLNFHTIDANDTSFELSDLPLCQVREVKTLEQITTLSITKIHALLSEKSKEAKCTYFDRDYLTQRQTIIN
jgi:hypothetical protein